MPSVKARSGVGKLGMVWSQVVQGTLQTKGPSPLNYRFIVILIKVDLIRELIKDQETFHCICFPNLLNIISIQALS